MAPLWRALRLQSADEESSDGSSESGEESDNFDCDDEENDPDNPEGNKGRGNHSTEFNRGRLIDVAVNLKNHGNRGTCMHFSRTYTPDGRSETPIRTPKGDLVAAVSV